MLSQLRDIDIPYESSWEKFVRYSKFWTYCLMYELLQSQVFSSFIFKMLFLLETFQMLYYTIQPKILFLWTSALVDYTRQTIQYLQINSLLSQGNGAIFIALLYFFFFMLVGSSGLMLFTMKLITNKQTKSSTFVTYSVKAIAWYALFQNTILFIPTFNIIIATLICKADSDIHREFTCYSGIYLLHMLVALIGMCVLFIQILLFTGLFIDLNPNSKIPFAATQNNNNLVRLLLKLFLPFYTVFDVEGKITSELIVVTTIYYFILLIHRYFTGAMYNQSVYNFIIMCEVLLFWLSSCILITRYLDTDEIDGIGIIYFLFMIPVWMMLYYQFIRHRDRSYLHVLPKQLKKDYQVEIYLSIVINVIENIEHPSERVKMEGILKLHSLNCTKKECICQQTLIEDEKGDEILTQRKWYLFLVAVIEEALEKFPKSSRLHLISSYIYQEKLKNKFKALYELMYTEDNDPNIQEEFSIFRYKQQIEEELIEQDQKSSENKGIDVNNIIMFQNTYVIFQYEIAETVNQYLEFWKELTEDNPDLQKLHNLGQKITFSIESVNEIFKELNDNNPNHLMCLQKYGYFQKDVVNDENESQRIIEKMMQVQKSQQMNKQFISNDKIKYSDNSNICILTISGNKGNMGIVSNCNNEIENILGFNKTDIIDQNTGKIMPKIYSELHDGFLGEFLKTSKEKVIGKDRLVMAQDKHGYIIPCNLMIKVYPNLEEGIQIVGFLTQKSQSMSLVKNQEGKQNDTSKNALYYIVYNAISKQIYGITKNCHDKFGIPSSLVYGNSFSNSDFSMEHISKDLDNTEKIEELRSPQGLAATIDTTQLREMFMLEEDEDEEKDENIVQEDLLLVKPKEIKDTSPTSMNNNVLDDSMNKNIAKDKQEEDQEIKTVYRQCKVRVYVEEEKEYTQNAYVRIIRFHEIEENSNKNIYKQNGQDNNYQENNKELKTQLDDIGEEIDQEDQEGDINFQKGDNDNLNEDDRAIKDFKVLISEKSVPRQLMILKRIMYFLLLLMCGLAIGEQQMKFMQNDDMQEGLQAINFAYLRHNFMVEVNYYARKLSMLANDFFPPDANINEYDKLFKEVLIEKVDQLQYIQLNITQSDLNIQEDIQNEKQYEIQFLLQNGLISQQQNLLQEAMFTYITSASSLAKSILSSYKFSSDLVDGNGDYTYGDAESQIVNGQQLSIYVDSTEKNFHYVTVNGLFALRKGSESVAERFYEEYKNKIDINQTNFLIMLLAASICLFASQCFLVPIVFKVHRTNNRVLSLFGIIPIHEIQYLIYKCEWYIDEQLDDNFKKEIDGDIEKKKENNEKFIEDTQVNQKLNDSIQPVMYNEKPNSQAISKIKLNGVSTQNLPKITTVQEEQEQHQINLHNKLLELKKQEEEQEQDGQDERSSKLMNTKDTNKRIAVMCQFGSICIFLFLYFLIGYILEVGFLDMMSKTYDHQQLISIRPSALSYNIMFTLEQIVLGEIQSEPGIEDLRTYFTEQIYENEGNILESYQNSYPSQYDKYLENFQQNNQGNICQFNDFDGTEKSDCEITSLGMLQKGLRTSNIALVENTRNLISLFNDTQMQKQDKVSTVNSESFQNIEQMKKYILPVMDDLNNQFLSAVKEYIDSQSNLELYKSIFFIIILFLLFLILWLPYLTRLNNKIWSTKGMLNMIPLEIILRHQKLKQTLQSGEIIKAVR